MFFCTYFKKAALLASLSAVSILVSSQRVHSDQLLLPADLHRIEAEAFCNDQSLESVVLPDGITQIDTRAFAGSSLQEINLPPTLTAIADDAFDGSSLQRVSAVRGTYAYTWALAHGYLQAETDASLFAYSAPSGDTVVLKGFLNKTDYPSEIILPSVSPDGYRVTSVGEGAFSGMTGLTSVEIRGNIASISANAFRNCTQLEHVTLCEGVKQIKGIVNGDSGAFSGCSALTELVLPGTLESIGNYTFYNCSGLQSLTIVESETSALSIGESAFAETNLSGTLTIPSKVSAIQASAFSETPIEALVIEPGENLHTISTNAFLKCLSLRSASIPGNVEAINTGAFRNCTKLEDLTLPEGLKSIGGVVNWDEGAFSGCISLQELVLPSTLESISNYGFHNCYGLKKLTILDSDSCTLSVGESAFAGSPLTNSTLTIPAKVSAIKASAFSGTSIKTLDIMPGSNLQTISASAFYNCLSLTTVNIPGNVTAINESAFKNCATLKNLNLPEGLKTIGGVVNGDSGAFSHCSSLTTLVIPSTLESIGNYAFDQCTSLASLTIRDSSECTLSIGEHAFAFSSLHGTLLIPPKVTAIKAMAFAGSTFEKLTIQAGQNLDVISEGAFRNCKSLTTVTIPGNVTSIHANAFRGCSAMETLTLSEGLKSILGVVNGNEGAFCDCIALKKLVIPSTVESIGRYTFSGCTSLATIQIKAKQWNITIGENAFRNCPGIPVYV